MGAHMLLWWALLAALALVAMFYTVTRKPNDDVR